MREMLTTFIFAFSTLIAIVDPIATIGPFLAMTRTDSDLRRKQTARKAIGVATVILIICAASGGAIFRFFGVTLPALKLAGGLLMFVLAFEMLYAHPSRLRQTDEEQQEGVLRDDIAVFPLAMPLLAGPGAIASVLLLTQEAHNWLSYLMVYVGILLTMAASYLVLRFAVRLEFLLGSIGINIFTRVMGLMLAAISAQFAIDAIHEAFPHV